MSIEVERSSRRVEVSESVSLRPLLPITVVWGRTRLDKGGTTLGSSGPLRQLRASGWQYATVGLYASWVAVLTMLMMAGSLDNWLVSNAFDGYGVLSVIFAVLVWRHRDLDRATRRV
jgi:hypothetical protein